MPQPPFSSSARFLRYLTISTLCSSFKGSIPVTYMLITRPTPDHAHMSKGNQGSVPPPHSSREPEAER